MNGRRKELGQELGKELVLITPKLSQLNMNKLIVLNNPLGITILVAWVFMGFFELI